MDGTDIASHKRASQDLSVITRLPAVTGRSSSTLPLRMRPSEHHLATVTASSGICMLDFQPPDLQPIYSLRCYYLLYGLWHSVTAAQSSPKQMLPSSIPLDVASLPARCAPTFLLGFFFLILFCFGVCFCFLRVAQASDLLYS